MNTKMDTLLDTLNIGRGAWLAYVKLGAFISFILGIAYTVWQFFHRGA